MVQLLKGGKIMSTRTTATIVNIRGKKMVELHVSDRWVGSFTNVVPYEEVKNAYDNFEPLFDWNEMFTRQVIRSLFEDKHSGGSNY